MSTIEMQVIVYLFRQSATDTVNFGQIFNACVTHSLQPPELPQQFSATFRTQPRNLFQS